MAKHRLFLAVKLPQDLINLLLEYQKLLPNDWFRIVPVDNLHLTLSFLGYIEEEKIQKIKTIVSETIANFKFQSQPIVFSQIEYGPNAKHPRLIWLKGVPNNNLQALKNSLEKALMPEIRLDLSKEQKEFIPHITLARIKKLSSQKLPPLPKTNIPVNYLCSPKSVWLMESQLHKTGAKYIDLAEFYL